MLLTISFFLSIFDECSDSDVHIFDECSDFNFFVVTVMKLALVCLSWTFMCLQMTRTDYIHLYTVQML